MAATGTHRPLLRQVQEGSFSGHETFTLRYGWLKKGVDAVLAQPDIFARESAMVDLGVGKNMVRSIRHWCLTANVIAEGEFVPGTRSRLFQPTPLGESLFVAPGWDPYMEDEASLWLLHWQITSNFVRSTTWHWAFHILSDFEFTRDSLTLGVERLIENSNLGPVSQASVKSDISCFLRTYVPGKRGPTATAEETLDCPLATLKLISIRPADERYRFNNGPKVGLPPAIFAYALVAYWQAHFPSQDTISLREITHGEGSPGRAFRLDEDGVLAYLDELDGVSGGSLVFRDTITSRLVARLRPVSGMEVLNAYYATG